MPFKDKEAQRAARRRYAKKWYRANIERERARGRAYRKTYYAENKAAILEKIKNSRRGTFLEKVLWRNAQQRARVHGIEFSISVEDIIVPEFCPILGLRLAIAEGSAKDFSPSIDRVDPAKGYIKGNVQVICHKANTIKSNATIQEMRAVLSYMEKLLA